MAHVIAENQVNLLHSLIVGTVKEGGKIVVVGWRDNHNNDFAESLVKAGLVTFHRNPPNDMRAQNFHLLTHEIGHDARNRVVKQAGKDRMWTHVLDPNAIKSALFSLHEALESNGAERPAIRCHLQEPEPKPWSIEEVLREEPTDPFLRSQWLAGNKPLALKRRADLEAELHRIKVFLDRVAAAEQLLTQLGKV